MRESTPNGGIVNFTLEQACQIVVVGVRVIGKRSTMIYDLLAFIPWATEAEIRATMLDLSMGPERKFNGCNDGCRGDWDLRESIDVELDRLFPDD